jgi:hypothetical protein
VTELDHVLVAVDDLDGAARTIEERHGLASVEGGRHQGLGTANRIVPLGSTYLELVGVVDEQEASASGFGSWVAGGDLPRLLGWCVRTELDAVSERLGLTIADGARARPDGTVLRWRMAGLERSAKEPSLPFFIEWGAGASYPGEALTQSATIDELLLVGDPDRIAGWLGNAKLPISIHEGQPALQSVLLRTSESQSVLDPTLWA